MARKGVWEPLPLIIYGYAVHPLSPSRRDTRVSARTRLSSTTVNSTATDERFVYRDVVALEVGDEVYAFERYTPKGKEVEGVWYRGYVVCTARRPTVSWPVSADPSASTSKGPTKTDESQQVFIGIFPASHIHIRDELSDAEGRLAALARAHNGDTSGMGAEQAMQWSRDRAMDTLREEDEDPDTLGRKSFKLGPPPDKANSSRAGLTVYPASLHSRSSSPTESHMAKPLPPRPSLKSGDDTASGAAQPVIDEIASALREWHALMFQYLARRDYRLFHTVRDHIEALHLGRRQLLAQTLSAEETVNLRRACVARLVSGNIVQGLDVIVRHPTWGGLVTVDVEGEIDTRSWVSAVRMYALQTSLAYLEVPPDAGPGPSPGIAGRAARASGDVATMSPLPTPAHPSFPDLLLPKSGVPGVHGTLTRPTHKHALSVATNVVKTAKFYHVFLDLRAFVASLCSPGETVELFFSLYNKAESRFVTEEFCAILNHNGVLARDPTAKIRTLFTDLVQSDVQDPIFLVCRIVRNGALKIGSTMSTGMPTPDMGHRTSLADLKDAASSLASRTSQGGDTLTPLSPNGSGRFAAHDAMTHIRRPFGCAVLELTQLSGLAAERSEISATREHTMPIYVPTNEAVYSMLHQDVIANNTKEFEKSPRAEMMAVSVKVFYGDAQIIVRENTSLLQDTPLTLRLGFPDVVFPGDVRNELYIKLWSGDFTSSNTGGSRLSVANFARGQMGPSNNNVMVSLEVRDESGRTMERVISMGSGEPPMTQFHSMVFQRNPQPTYGELVKLTLPQTGMSQWHLFFTFRHRGTKDHRASMPRGATSDSMDKPFAFAFLPLFPESRAFLEDGSHTLVLYRADKIAQLTTDMYLGATPWHTPGQRSEQIQAPLELQKIAMPMRDTITLRSSLCSTRFTQNPVLLTLLNWQQIPDKDLMSTILTKFTFVGEMEIVKFLRDIFDSLFGILVSNDNQGGEMDHLVFNALVTVLGIVQDRRFRNFQPVLDVYIEEHFNNASASTHMIHSMNRLLANPTASEIGSNLRAALKVWHYIFKFIARSRELQKAKEVGVGGGATAEHLESTFRRELRSHLSEVNRMMSTTSPASIIGTQTIALQHFTSILSELAKIFTTVELVTLATAFANSIALVKGKIVFWKLIMYLQLVKGFLFENPQSRSLLVEAVVIWIKPYFGRFDEYAHTQPGDSESAMDAARISWLEGIRLCVTIIAVMLDRLQTSLVDPAVVADRNLLRQEQDNVEYLLSLLPRLLASYLELQSPASRQALERTRTPGPTTPTVPVTFPESYPFSLVAYLPSGSNSSQSGPLAHSATMFNPALGETAIVFLVLILSSPMKHVFSFLESSFEIEGRENFTTLLTQIFKVATSILDNEAFPSNWLNVNILAHKVVVKLMDPVATILEREFIPDQQAAYQFDANLWREGIFMLLKLLSSEQLVIEEFSPQKRRAVWRLAGDVRGDGAAILLKLWDSLGWPEDVAADSGAVTRFGGYQVALNTLVGAVVNLCLSHHDQLRSNAVHVLYSMIISEYHMSEQFDEIENEVVNKLDSLFMSDSKGDEISRTFFIGQLRHLFDSSQVDERLRERVASFLDSVDLFLELLLSVRALPEGEEFADDRVIATLRLMNFIRRIGRDEMYIKYVHQLVNMHLQSQNYVEAALTLKLHSDLHEWDLHSFVPPMEELGLPQQSQFHRKETLCLLILDYLGKGKAWENAMDICKELAYQHEEVTFNYGRLSEILRHQASLLEHIVSDQRYYPEYFRVAYYGNFPAAIRNKNIIFRGFEWEKFGAFCERMLNKHTGAQLLKTMGDPPVDIRFGTDQYIQCTAVTPEPNRDLPIFTNPEVPAQVRTYYEHTGTNLFSCSRPVTKVGRDGTDEVWTEKTYFTTEASFPTVLRRSEVLSVEVLEISPIEMAISEVEQKTKELAALFVRYSAVSKTAQVVSTNALSMTLNGAVDSPGNGGVPTLRQMFLSQDYIARYPDRAAQIAKLTKAIDEHVQTIESCLKLHGQMCPPEMIPFHETLEKFFRRNFHEEIQRLVAEGLSDFGYADSISSKLHNTTPSQYQASLYDQSSKVSVSSESTSRMPYVIPPLQLGRPTMTPPPGTPTATSPRSSQQDSVHRDGPGGSGKPTHLKRHLAHLARHGINGVSATAGPEQGAVDAHSVDSPTESFINVGAGGSSVNPSSASAVLTTNGAPSLKGRLSRLGSLSFKRRDG